ncbi:TorF family putative porin [Ferrimonas futtsuensis]|uniref:TorF family putative porin n=1 Tax=Ferrimonas futtsuensis TaxID=364764 RepID=UPI000419D237|nr:TorF family putative porin [Ferrimonas futtsuensis]
MKKMTALALALISSQALANDAPVSFSGYTMGLSNYLWRGQTISLDNPSLQSDLMVEHDSGFYAGVSYETYRYEGEVGEEVKDYEIDYYGGYYQMLTDDLGIGLMAMKYTYGDGGDTVEYTLSLDYQSLGMTVNYDEDVKAWYTDLNYGLGLFHDSTLELHAGMFFDAENYGYGDENNPDDSFYDVALRYDYPVLENLSLLLEASYQEYDKDHYMVGVAYWF